MLSCTLSSLTQALQHYGESIRHGHKHILQALPRLLTLYFEFGSRVAAAKAVHQRMRNAHTQVRHTARNPYVWNFDFVVVVIVVVPLSLHG